MPAIITGTLAPDFEYFLLLAPRDGFGHTLLGALILSLPLALIVLWLFQHVVRGPLIALLPNGIQHRWRPPAPLNYSNPTTLAWIALSALIGVATHIFWDSFTHPNTWMYEHWSLLRRPLHHVPFAGSLQCYKLFQHGSTLVGICILVLWFLSWYRKTKPHPADSRSTFSPHYKSVAVALLFGSACIGAFVRAVLGSGLPASRAVLQGFAGEAVTTFIALLWWELFIYGLLSSRSR